MLGGFAYAAIRSTFAKPNADHTPELIFAGLLGLGALGALLLGYATFRKQILINVKGNELIIHDRGLWSSQAACPRAPGDYLVLASLVTEKERGHSTTYELYLCGLQGDRSTLASDHRGRMVEDLAGGLAREMGIASADKIRINFTEDAELKLLQLHADRLRYKRDSALDEMRTSLREVEQERDIADQKLQSEEFQSNDQDEKSRDAEAQERADQDLDRMITNVERAEIDAMVQDIAGYEFSVVELKHRLEYSRRELGADFTPLDLVFMPSMIGIGILTFISAPFVVPIFGLVLVSLFDLLPEDVGNPQMRDWIVEACSFGEAVFLYAPGMFLLYFAWVWLKIAASFSKFEVRFDWPTRQISVLKDGTPPDRIAFESIEAFAIGTVFRFASSENQRQRVDWLTAELSDRSVPIL